MGYSPQGLKSQTRRSGKTTAIIRLGSASFNRMHSSLSKLWETVKDRGAWRAAFHGWQSRAWLYNKLLYQGYRIEEKYQKSQFPRIPLSAAPAIRAGRLGVSPPPVLLPGIWLVQFRQIKHKMQVSQLTIEHWWVLVKKKILELSRNLPAPRESKEERMDWTGHLFLVFFFLDVDHFQSLYWICYNIAFVWFFD